MWWTIKERLNYSNMEKVYRITYFETDTGMKQTYMNNTGFTELDARSEIRRLKKQQDDLVARGFKRTRRDFNYSEIIVRDLKRKG